MRRASRAMTCFCLAICALAAGCEEAPSAELLDVESVGPARIDPGHRLVVEGAGFAVGHDVRVALVGVLARPFAPDEPIDETFVAEAVAEDRVEMRVTETLLRERFGRATFRGRVEVLFDARWDDRLGTISGALDDRVIDFVPARAATTEGTPFDEALGVTIADRSDEGLEIAEVRAGGVGASLGLGAGDVLVAIGHAQLVPGDAPRVPAGPRETSLTIARDGHTTELRLDLGASDHDEERASERTILLQLAILVVYAALLRAWPLRSVDVAPPSPPRALARPTLAIVVRCLVGLVIAHVALRGIVHLPSIGLAIACLVGLRGATAIAGSPRPVAQLPAIVVSSVALAIALGALPAALDRSSVLELASDGAVSPLAWPFFRELVGVPSMVLLALAIGAARPTRPLARTADDLWLALAAVIAVLAGTGLCPLDRFGAIGADVAVVLVAWLLGRAREHGRASTPALGIVLGLSGVVVLIASAWVLADPSAAVRHALAQVSLAAVLVTIVMALHHAIRERPAPRPQHALL